METSLARQNFSQDSEAVLNKQINIEFTASYTYQSMAAYLSRSSVSLPGLAKYCAECAEEERGHALKLIDYVTKRGGKAVLLPLAQPESEWTSAVHIMSTILELEREVNAALLAAHKVASDSQDPQLTDYLEGEFLEEQVKAIHEVASMMTQLKRVGGDGLGLYLWDRELLEHK